MLYQQQETAAIFVLHFVLFINSVKSITAVQVHNKGVMMVRLLVRAEATNRMGDGIFRKHVLPRAIQTSTGYLDFGLGPSLEENTCLIGGLDVVLRCRKLPRI